MSAVTTWQPAAAPLRTARPRLVSVPAGDAVAVPQLGPVRLTRAGRLAVTLAVVVLALATMAWRVIGPAPVVADHSVVVEAGQTLSEIAAVELPGLDVRAAVTEIQLLNELPSTEVRGGQVLRIPAA